LRCDGNRSIGSIALIAAFSVGVLSIFASGGHAESEFIQSQENFEKAMRDRSTSPHVILVTVVNDNTGEAHTECFPAPFLLGAIHREYDLNYDAGSIEKAMQMVLANSSRTFHFSKQSAIENLPPFREGEIKARYHEACALVREGKSVFLSDRGGQVRVDP
jgi:hypothetical protein